jgi:hypothetical protein
VNIPPTITIGAHTIETIQDHLFVERTDVLGTFSLAQNTIRVASVDGSGVPMSRTAIEQVWCHEVVHAIDAIYNGRKLDEDTTERLSQGVYQVVRQLLDAVVS